MTCTIPNKKKSAIDAATAAFIGNSKSFKVVRPGVIEMPVSSKFGKNQLYAIATTKSHAVNKAMELKYGRQFTFGWVAIDATSPNLITARIFIPNILVQAWHVQLGLKTLEEVNADPDLYRRDISFYQRDAALMEQEHKNDDDFYAENDESFSNFETPYRYSWADENGEYDSSKNWNQNGNTSNDVYVTDAEIERIKRNKNIC
jgi:hypothetical protein